MEQRYNFIKEIQKRNLSLAELCRQFGFSRTTGYKWLKRYLTGGLDSLADESRRPKTNGNMIDEYIVAHIIKTKMDELTLGPKKIKIILEKEMPEIPWPSITTIENILKRHGLTKSRKPKRRTPLTAPLGHCEDSNNTWCIDYKGWFKTQDGSINYPFTVTDAYTRYLIRCVNLRKETNQDTWPIMEMAFREYGLPLKVRSDNGPPFGSKGAGRLTRFAVNLIKAGTIPEWINPGCPQENGRHERFHKTLKECTANPRAFTFIKQQQSFDEFTEFYNFRRPHESLDQKPPGDIYEKSTKHYRGKLISPEYSSEYSVRKVHTSGQMKFRGTRIYVNQSLGNEPVGIIESEKGFEVHYGPIYLGIINGEKLEFPVKKPKRLIRKK